jgi:hypothetical protein
MPFSRLKSLVMFVSLVLIVTGRRVFVLEPNDRTFPSWLGEKDLRVVQDEVLMRTTIASMDKAM